MPPRTSVAAERGLANWPASRPSRITGRPDAAPSLCAIAATRLTIAALFSGENSAKLSAQSPPWSRKARPACASASIARNASISRSRTRDG